MNVIISDATVAGLYSQAKLSCFNIKNIATYQSPVRNAKNLVPAEEGSSATCNSALLAVNATSIPHTRAVYASYVFQFESSTPGGILTGLQHMTKHASAAFLCWSCSQPTRSFSGLIEHVESGSCPMINDPSRLIQSLGEWWYSPLFMDLDIHAQLRTGRINAHEVQTWMEDGILMPFICREEGCKKSFGQLSSLVSHLESKTCGWDIERLNIPGLETLFKKTYMLEKSPFC